MNRAFLKTALLAAGLSLLGGKVAMAQSAPYGMAGCGLGAMLFEGEGKNEKGWQILNWFLNGFYSNQTFGISSGTSNCVESRTATAAMEQEVFVTANLTSLSREAAQGGGEHLRGLAEVMGCTDDVGAGELARLSQDRYDALFQEQTPTSVLGNYLREIRAHDVLAKDCTRAT